MDAQNDILRPRRAGSGFTLTELLLAMGILSLGLIMVAGVFAAGLRQSQLTTNRITGQMICQNALAAAQARLSDELLAGIPGYFVDISQGIGYANLSYPLPPADAIPDNDIDWIPRTLRGANVFARRVGANDYVLLAVAWRCANRNNPVLSRSIQVDVDTIPLDAGDVAMRIRFAGGDAGYVATGGVVIFTGGPNNGRYAMIEALGENEARLSHTNLQTGDGQPALVLYEDDAGGAPNPVIAAQMSRVGLRGSINP